MGGDEGIYEKLLCDGNMKVAKEDDVGEYVDNDEKMMRIGRMQFLFYVFGTIVLLPIGVFALCVGSMTKVYDNEFDCFWFSMLICFLWTSQLGGTLLCEAIPSLNVETLPEMIDIGGAYTCGLATCVFYYSTQLCLSIISENTPGRRFIAARYLINGTYVFTIVSGVLFLGFFLISCRRIIFTRSGAVAGPVDRIIAHPERGRIAVVIYKVLTVAIFFIILSLVKDNLLSVSVSG